jgi:hypothetical protein
LLVGSVKRSAGEVSNIDLIAAVGSAEAGTVSGLKARKEVHKRERSEQLKGAGLRVREEAGKVIRWREMEIWRRRLRYIGAFLAIFFF